MSTTSYYHNKTARNFREISHQQNNVYVANNSLLFSNQFNLTYKKSETIMCFVNIFAFIEFFWVLLFAKNKCDFVIKTKTFYFFRHEFTVSLLKSRRLITCKLLLINCVRTRFPQCKNIIFEFYQLHYDTF